MWESVAAGLATAWAVAAASDLVGLVADLRGLIPDFSILLFPRGKLLPIDRS